MRDPERDGAETARLHADLAPTLLRDLEQSGALDTARDADAGARARREWECFALYACVRGIVAARGFNRETGAAIDALHQHALAEWRAEDHDGETLEQRRALVAERYAEYGAIGQAGGAGGAATVTARLGEAAARHMIGGRDPSPDLAELVGHLHESLAEGAAEMLRRRE